MDDDNSDEVVVHPTNVIQCINKDGSINLLKYSLFRRYKRRQKKKNDDVIAYSDNIIDDAYSSYIDEMEDNGDEYCRTRNNKKRSVFRKGINKRRKEDGSIEEVTAKQSSWYVTYVDKPQLDCEKFNNKFRRRFRCHYQSYLLLLVRVLKTGIRIHGVEVTDSIWLTCCSLHNLFLEQDGLNKEWENGTSIWVGPLGDHDEEEVRRYGPRHLLDNNTINPTQLDLTGMGPGTDESWPQYNNNNKNEEEKESNDSDSGTSTTESINENNINNNINNNEYNNNNSTSDNNSEVEPVDNNNNDNIEVEPVDNILGAIDVNDLDFENFQQLLIDQYDVLYQQNKIIWPSRLGKIRLRYNTNIS
jgi:hypothetical protein